MKKILKSLSTLMVAAITASMLMSTAFAADKDYATAKMIYDAEWFLDQDGNPMVGVEQLPALGNSGLDKNDKKQGESSLFQKTGIAGQGLTTWLCGDDKFGGTGLDVSSVSNLGLSLWIYVSKVENLGMGGDITMDFGSGSVGGAQNDSNKYTYWLHGANLKDGWNHIVVSVPKKNPEGGEKELDGFGYGFGSSADAVNFSAVNFFRLIVQAKDTLEIKIDDIRFVDLDKPASQGEETKTDDTTKGTANEQTGTTDNGTPAATETKQENPATADVGAMASVITLAVSGLGIAVSKKIKK